ncbi:MAG: hypothetical protein AAGC70_10285 [Pseudomonadota bacterium]
MMDILSWLFFFVFIVGLIAVAGMLVRGYVRTGSTGVAFGSGLFHDKPAKRLGLVEETNLDGRRKLMIVRRDGVEHLIMIGGPIDIVVESGIEHGGERLGRGSDAKAPRVVHSALHRPQAVGE